MRILYPPFLTLIVFEGIGKHSAAVVTPGMNLLFYATASGLTLIIYPRMLMWFSFWVGLNTRTRLRSMMTMLLVVLGSAIVPLLANFLWYGSVLFLFRALCLHNAERYLGRGRYSNELSLNENKVGPLLDGPAQS